MPYEQRLAVTLDGVKAQGSLLDRPRMGATLVTLPDLDAMHHARVALLFGGHTDLDPTGTFSPTPAVERIDLAAGTAAPLPPDASMPQALLPDYLFPTVTLIDTAPGKATRRLLVSGGLQLSQGPAGATANLAPPTTLQIISETEVAAASPPPDGGAPAPMSPAYGVTQVQPAPAVWSFDPACTAKPRYRPVAFDAATLLPSGDRVLTTGGTPRVASGCNDCPTSTDGLGCALAQSAIVTVPATGASQVVPAGPAPNFVDMQVARYGHTQTVLADGTVLVVGGFTRRAALPPAAFATYVVSAAEVWNAARLVPPTPVRDPLSTALSDPDDPLRADLAALGLSRLAGGQAFKNGDPSRAAAQPCGAPR